MNPTPSPLPSAGASSLTFAGDDGDVPTFVLWYVIVAALLALVWFGIRALARRDVRWAVAAYDRADPLIHALRQWAAMAPVTTIYVACWTSTTLVFQGAPPDVVNLLVRSSSTNLLELLQGPLRAMVVSALIVADNGVGFILYVIAFALIVARLEHRVGSARLLLIWVVSHMGASLITVGIEVFLLRNGAPQRLAVTADVGVSYVMVGSMGAYLLLVSRKWRPWYFAAMAIGILGPLILSHKIVDVGHFLATVLGTTVAYFAIHYGGTRSPILWRTLRTAAPRQLQS